METSTGSQTVTLTGNQMETSTGSQTVTLTGNQMDTSTEGLARRHLLNVRTDCHRCFMIVFILVSESLFSGLSLHGGRGWTKVESEAAAMWHKSLPLRYMVRILCFRSEVGVEEVWGVVCAPILTLPMVHRSASSDY